MRNNMEKVITTTSMLIRTWSWPWWPWWRWWRGRASWESSRSGRRLFTKGLSSSRCRTIKLCWWWCIRHGKVGGFKKLSTFLVKLLLLHHGIIFVDSVVILLISLDHVDLVDLFIIFAVNLTTSSTWRWTLINNNLTRQRYLSCSRKGSWKRLFSALFDHFVRERLKNWKRFHSQCKEFYIAEDKCEGEAASLVWKHQDETCNRFRRNSSLHILYSMIKTCKTIVMNSVLFRLKSAFCKYFRCCCLGYSAFAHNHFCFMK